MSELDLSINDDPHEAQTSMGITYKCIRFLFPKLYNVQLYIQILYSFGIIRLTERQRIKFASFTVLLLKERLSTIEHRVKINNYYLLLQTKNA